MFTMFLGPSQSLGYNGICVLEEASMEDTELQEQRKKKGYCRFCAQNKKCEDLLDLTIDKETLQLYLTILEFFKIDFINLSNLNIPKTTCESCYNMMLTCYRYFQNMKEAQTILNKLYCSNANLIKIEIVSDENKEDAISVKSRRSSVDSNSSNQTNSTINKSDGLNGDELKTESLDDDLSKPNSTPDYLSDELSKSNSTTEYLDDELSKPNSTTEYLDDELTKPNSTKEYLDDDLTKPNSTSQSDDDDCVNISNSTDEFPMTYCGLSVFEDEEAECNDIIENEDNDDSWQSYTWSCKHCDVECESMDDLRSHGLQLHRKCYAFKCDDCDDCIFHTFNSFVEHVRQHRNELRYYCPHCNIHFKSISDCSKHTLTHWSAGQKICQWCGKVFPDERALKLHKSMSQPVRLAKKLQRLKPRVLTPARQYNGIPVFEGESNIEPDSRTWDNYEWTCGECSMRFPSVHLLRTHTQELHSKCFSMKCVDCPAVLRSYRLFVAHVAGHRPILKTYCPYCNTHIKTAIELKNHIDIHLKGPKKNCYECGQIFENEQLASQHYEKFEPIRRDVPIEDLTCNVCNSTYRSLSTLRSHKKTHDKNRIREHVCDTCGKQFYQKRSLMVHLITHGNKTNSTHVCKVCDKSFLTKLYLRAHVLGHLNSENSTFICDYCSKEFKMKRRVMDHINRMHMGKTNFKHKCQICSKQFSASGIKIHMRIHSGERPYNCQHCEKTFTNWGNCNKHMKRIHKTTLAKTVLTKQGRIPIGKLAEVKNMAADTKQWMQDLAEDQRKPRRKQIARN